MDYLVNKNGKEVLIEGEMQTIKRDVSSLFKNYRKSKNMTQQTLADKAGMNRVDVSRFESGKYNPSLELMARYALALDCDIKLELISQEHD